MAPSSFSRRALLRATAAGTALAGSSFARLAHGADRRLKLAPVQLSSELVSKTIVGLRPFRPSGYVVRAERFSEKTLVHHYGHGGCGVTLSWGTAELAANLVGASSAREIAVLGGGVIGLTTARVLQQRGLDVTIYTRDVSPDTCSDVAGARWYPFDVFDSKVVTPAFTEGLWRMSRIAYAAFKKMAGPAYGIFFRPTYMFQRSPLPKTSLLQLNSPIRDLLPGLRELTPEENPTGASVTRTFETMMIEPPIYLPALFRDFTRANGKLVRRTFSAPSDIAALKERVVVNCTGLGAAALFGDAELIPIKGQLTLLKPQPAVDYVALAYGQYMFPRNDSIVLGGTFERGVSTLEPDREAEKRILGKHAQFFDELRKIQGKG